jgi:hypothetical protein
MKNILGFLSCVIARFTGVTALIRMMNNGMAVKELQEVLS